MKHMKKMISLMLVLLLVVAMGAPAFAIGGGSITINGVSTDNTYEIYELLKLESYDKASGVYSYKVVDPLWETFFTSGASIVIRASPEI